MQEQNEIDTQDSRQIGKLNVYGKIGLILIAINILFHLITVVLVSDDTQSIYLNFSSVFENLISVLRFPFASLIFWSLLIGFIATRKRKEKFWNSTFVAGGILSLLLLSVLALGLTSTLKNHGVQNETEMETRSPVTIPGFQLYTDESRGLTVLFPETPTVTDLELIEGLPATNLSSVRLLNDEELVQYQVSYMDLKIDDKSAIEDYLIDYPKARAAGISPSAIMILNSEATYKNLPARKYSFEYEAYGSVIKNRGVVFMFNGRSIDLLVSYHGTVSDDVIYFDEFIDSFHQD